MPKVRVPSKWPKTSFSLSSIKMFEKIMGEGSEEGIESDKPCCCNDGQIKKSQGGFPFPDEKGRVQWGDGFVKVEQGGDVIRMYSE